MSADNKIAFQQSVDAFVAIDTIDQEHADPLGQFPAAWLAFIRQAMQRQEKGEVSGCCRVPIQTN